MRVELWQLVAVPTPDSKTIIFLWADSYFSLNSPDQRPPDLNLLVYSSSHKQLAQSGLVSPIVPLHYQACNPITTQPSTHHDTNSSMDQNTNAVAVEQQESIDRAYRLSSGSNIGEEGMKKMQQDTHETLSTVSSESQETAESSAIHNAQGYPAYETDPTSKASDVLDKSDQKPLDSDPSDRADCGSDFVRSETGSSSSSVDSRKSLPVPTIDESVEGAGSHIHNQGINSTELNIDLGDVNETQPVFERVERMSGKFDITRWTQMFD